MIPLTLIVPLRHDEGGKCSVDRFDVLIWSLTGFVKTQRLIYDFGIALTVGQPGLTSIDLLLPFVLNGPEDSCDLGGAKRLAEDLITPKANVDDGVVRIGDDDYTIARLQDRVEIVDKGEVGSRRQRWSRVRLTIRGNPRVEGERIYVRARFHPIGGASTVLWKRSGLGINGAIFDVETRLRPNEYFVERVAEDSIAEVHMTSVTVVLRSSLQRQASFPPDLEAGLLPHGIWEEYLERPTDWRRDGSLVSYRGFFDHESANPEDSNRFFLDVSREFGLLPLGNLLRTLLLAVAVAAVVLWSVPRSGPLDFSWLTSWVHMGEVWQRIAGAGLAGAVGLGTYALSKIRRLRTWLSRARVRFHRRERWLQQKRVRRPDAGT